MLDFFGWIADLFTTLWTFLTTLIESLITFFQVIVQSLTLPPLLTVGGLLPTFVVTSLLAVVSIGLCKLIIGRN